MSQRSLEAHYTGLAVHRLHGVKTTETAFSFVASAMRGSFRF
jgi:hypothetical protein